MYLLDTNVISEMRKRGRANAGVQAFFRQAAESDAGLYLSAITVGELRRGVELIRRRGDIPQAAMLESWLAGVLGGYARHILAVDPDIAQVWGRLRAGHPEHALDKLIAATALIHDLTVVTRDTGGYAGSGARLLNPFSGH